MIQENMDNALEFNDLMKCMDSSGKNILFESLIENTNNHIHSVNQFIVYEGIGIYYVINTDSKHIVAFNKEDEAMNYCLDNYEQTKRVFQPKILF